MNPVSAIVVFIMIWWVVIFCVLPVGLSKTQETQSDEEGYIAPGAPKNLNIKRKFIITTLISIMLWGIAVTVIQMDLIDFHTIAQEME